MVLIYSQGLKIEKKAFNVTLPLNFIPNLEVNADASMSFFLKKMY